MEQPMLSVTQKQQTNSNATVNLLPCRIHHDGAVGPADSYWMPSTEEDGKKIAYFRGRKLHGKTVKVPEGYRGVVVEKKEAPAPRATRPDELEVVDVDAEEEDVMPLGALEMQAGFDEMVIWGHESVAEASSDPYVRGVDEWMKLAEQIHSYETDKGRNH